MARTWRPRERPDPTAAPAPPAEALSLPDAVAGLPGAGQQVVRDLVDLWNRDPPSVAILHRIMKSLIKNLETRAHPKGGA